MPSMSTTALFLVDCRLVDVRGSPFYSHFHQKYAYSLTNNCSGNQCTGRKTTDWGLYWVLLKAQVETCYSVTNYLTVFYTILVLFSFKTANINPNRQRCLIKFVFSPSRNILLAVFRNQP